MKTGSESRFAPFNEPWFDPWIVGFLIIMSSGTRLTQLINASQFAVRVESLCRSRI